MHALRDGTRLRRIGGVAEAAGLTQRAIRYYEELGLLKPAAHLSGANRRFDDEDLERLRLIKRLRDVVGLELAEVQTFLETDEERRMLRGEYLATSDPSGSRRSPAGSTEWRAVRSCSFGVPEALHAFEQDLMQAFLVSVAITLVAALASALRPSHSPREVAAQQAAASS